MNDIQDYDEDNDDNEWEWKNEKIIIKWLNSDLNHY